ncbi:MAG: hypothetical protein ACI9BD_000777 [Candidatus Marinamargulisbacteria bacterium]|jgi:hypothetical protein
MNGVLFRFVPTLAAGTGVALLTGKALDREAEDRASYRMENNKTDMAAVQKEFAKPMQDLMKEAGRLNETELRGRTQDIMDNMSPDLKKMPMWNAVKTANWVAFKMFPGSAHAALNGLTEYASTDRGQADFTCKTLMDVGFTQMGSKDGKMGESAFHRKNWQQFPASAAPAVWGPETVRGSFAMMAAFAAQQGFAVPVIGSKVV